MKKIIIVEFVVLIFVIVFAVQTVKKTAYDNKNGSEKDVYSDINGVDVADDNVLITRARAAKMIALLFFDHKEIEGYVDENDENRYSKYFTASEKCGAVWNTEAGPDDYITYGEMIGLFAGLTGKDTESIRISAGRMVSTVKQDDKLTARQWFLLYDLLRDELLENVRDMYNDEIFLLSIIQDEPSWKVASDRGFFYFDGFAVDAYVNGTIKIMTDGTDIVYIYGMSDKESVLENIWLESVDGEGAGIFCAGATAVLSLSEDVSAIESEVLPCVADIHVKDGVVTEIICKNDRRTDKILSVSDSGISTYGNGELIFSGDCKVYRLYDGPAETSKSNIVVGYSASDIVVDADGSVCAVLITQKVEPAVIRVAIKTDGFRDYYHESISLSSDLGMTVTAADPSAAVFHPAGESVVINYAEAVTAGNKRYYITPAAGGRIMIGNLNRAGGGSSTDGKTSFYRGSLELYVSEKGIVMINELSVEEYLYAVIPGEMPVSYGMEALKAQAVCARSYAYIQIMQGGLSWLGAHVDDSTAYQVYNNQPETPESIAAVNETAGQVLMYDGSVVPTYYYSTSCGYSADGSEVWMGMKEVPYLQGGLQTYAGNELGDKNLSDEKDFLSFLDNTELVTYDSAFPWYRWRTVVPADVIRTSVEASLKSRYEVNPSLILTKYGSAYISRSVDKIGKIRSVKVTGRGKGGIVTEVVIKGSKKTIKVRSEYNIRLLLAPKGIKIYRNDGSIVDGLSMLPSAFFVITSKKTENGKVFEIKGGGYGHGVGMSQNGAKAMADAGFVYTDILGFYFRGCSCGVFSS